ncbi:hypothetical protein ABPG74_006277 [Tetrahymena malaccensis]
MSDPKVYERNKSKQNLSINLLPLIEQEGSQQFEKNKTEEYDGQDPNFLSVPQEKQYDEILIFKSAMEKGLKFNNLEQSFRLIFSTIKQFITDYTSKLGLRQSELARNEQANNCLMEYNKLMEYQCYDLIRIALEFVLTDECEIGFQLKPTKSKKYKSQMYISKLKQHFKNKRKGSLQNLFTKLSLVEKSNKINYFAEDSDEEGFFDGVSVCDDNQTDTARSLKIKNTLKMEFADSDLNFQNGGGISNAKAKEFEDKIKELENLVKIRDEQIQGLTTGYIKDLTHMKEMIFRKQNIDEIEFYEVQYFDGTSNLDEKTRLALNDKLKTLKQNFEMKTREYVKKIFFLSTEHEKLKKQYNQIAANKGDTMEMFKKIFECQENPYILWKQIQEIKGNKFFFDVFERQRPEFGINYKEVNQMLMSKKAYEKEYNYYKEQNDDSLVNLIKRCSGELDEIRQQLEEKEEELLKLKSEQKEDNQKKMERQIANMKVYLEQKESELYNKFESDRNQIVNEYEDADKWSIKSLYFRWSCINKIIKIKNLHDNQDIIKQIQQLLVNNPFQNDIVIKYENKIKQIEEEMKKVASKYDDLNLQIIYEKSEKDEALAEKLIIQEMLDSSKQKIIDLNEQNKNKESKLQLYQNILSNIYKHIGVKIDDSQFDAVNLDDEKKTSTKEFKKKMARIDKTSLRRLREEQIIGEKVIDTHQEIFQNIPTQTVGTMTDLMNLQIPIVYQSSIEKQVKQQKKEIAEQFQKQFDTLQNQFTNEIIQQKKNYEDEIQKLKQNAQSRNQSRKTSTRKSDLVQAAQSESKTSIQESELGDNIADDLNQQEIKNINPAFSIESQNNRKSFFMQALTQMGLDKEDQEAQTDNEFLANYETTIEYQKKQIDNFQEENNKLLSQIALLQQDLLKLKERPLVITDQRLQNTGSFLMTPQKTIRSDHQLIEADNKGSYNIADFIQEQDYKADINNQQQQESGYASPDSTENRLTSQFITKKNNISNKDGITIKRDSSKPLKSKKKKVFDRLFQDSKDKASRLELLKKHLDQIESFQWEEILTMLNLYSKEQDQSNDEAFYYLQQKILQDKVIPYAERNQAANREKNLRDFVLSQQTGNLTQEQIQNVQNQSNYLVSKMNKIQKTITRAEYFYKKSPDRNSFQISQEGKQNVTRRQSLSPNSQRECDENIVNTFQELNQENYDKKKQYMDHLYDNFKKHNNRIRSSISNNTSQDDQQMKIYFLDKKKRLSNIPRITVDEAKGLSFYDTQNRRSLNSGTSQRKRSIIQNTEETISSKNSSYINSQNSRTQSSESPRNKLYSQFKQRPINSSQENKRLITKRTVINTEKVLKQKDDQKMANEKISEKCEKIKDSIKLTISQNNSVFIPDSIYSIMKGKNYQTQQQNNETPNNYQHNLNQE